MLFRASTVRRVTSVGVSAMPLRSLEPAFRTLTHGTAHFRVYYALLEEHTAQDYVSPTPKKIYEPRGRIE